MNIRVKTQDQDHQYDANGNIISSMMVLYDKEILFSMRPDGTQYLADDLTLNL